MKYIVANWKSHKTADEAKSWMTAFQKLLTDTPTVENALIEGKIAVVICPTYLALPELKNTILNLPHYQLGAQNVSAFATGSFTGEIAAELIKDVASYVIVGHSERRAHCAETEEHIEKKLAQARANGLKSILCVRGSHDKIYQDADVIAYEPVEAIGSGQNAGVAEVLQMKQTLGLDTSRAFLYGGSVDPQNCAAYLKTDEIDGLLIGTASLDPARFFQILSSI